jgi:hypothetical protein
LPCGVVHTRVEKKLASASAGHFTVFWHGQSSLVIARLFARPIKSISMKEKKKKKGFARPDVWSGAS